MVEWCEWGLESLDYVNDDGELVVFVMVPDSRINSWESWFIFNL
jgi:hypothetical protein